MAFLDCRDKGIGKRMAASNERVDKIVKVEPVASLYLFTGRMW